MILWGMRNMALPGIAWDRPFQGGKRLTRIWFCVEALELSAVPTIGGADTKCPFIGRSCPLPGYSAGLKG